MKLNINTETSYRNLMIMIILIFVSTILIIFFTDGCGNRNNTHETESVTKYLKDSTHYLEQEVIATQINEIKKLEDSLQKAMSKNSDVTPNTIVKYKEIIKYKDINAGYLDSVDNYLDTIIAQQKVIDSSRIISVPKRFAFDKQWISGRGVVTKSTVNLDSINVKSEPTIVFGEKKGIITALVGNKNPYATQSELKVFTYKPKKKLLSLVAGPSYVFDGSGLKVAVGVTLGLKIF